MMNYTCKCGKPFTAEVKGSGVIIICPYCNHVVTSISDYGYGPIVPCNIYVGMEIVATIENMKESGTGEYWLKSEKYKIDHKLSGGYADLRCYTEAEKYLEEWLASNETESQHYKYH